MSGSSEAHVAYTDARTQPIEDRVELLQRRIRLRTWIDFALAVALAVLLALYLSVILARSTTRAYYNGQLHSLACALVQFTPPGDELGDQLRSHYNCPDYQKPTRSSTSSPPSPSRTAAATPTAPGRTTVVERPTTVITTNQIGIEAAPPTTRPSAPTATPTPRRSNSPTPPAPTSDTGLIPGVLCLLIDCKETSP